MKRTKRFISMTLILAMVLSIAGCSEEEQQQTSSVSFPWIDSCVFENIELMADANIKDDFAAAVDYEWASAQERDFTYRIMSFGECERKVVENKRALLDDESIQDPNLTVLRIADDLFTDWEYRDAIGVDPLKKYLGYIDEIKTLDDVSSYMIDNDKNPFGAALVELDQMNNEAVEGYRALSIELPKLSMGTRDYYICMTADGYKEKERVETRVTYLLERCGYSEKEIKDVLNRSFRFESELINLDINDGVTTAEVSSMSDVISMAGKYPLKEMFDHYSLVNCDNIMGELNYLDGLDFVYNKGNVEDMKAYFKVRLVLESFPYLDAGAFDCYKDSGLDRTSQFAERIDKAPDYSYFYLIRDTSLTAAMDQAYLDYYYNEATYEEITGFVQLIKEKYVMLINANEHLSEESKQAVINKLNNMGENIMMPSNRADFSDVVLTPKEEGGTYLDALCVFSKIKYEHISEMVQMPVEKTFWDIYDGEVSTTRTGASYHNMQNAIYIYAGILEAPIYTPDAPIEQKLGSFVAVLGHEISHAFDSDGVNRDENGDYKALVKSDEMSFWNETALRIKEHFYNIEPFEGAGSYGLVSTVDYTGEVIADIEGVRVSLLIAEDYDNFDYDLFFRSYAGFWRRLNSKSDEVWMIRYDEHPLSYLRINYTLCQFDEFVETYDLKPGDGMYLAPEQRVLIW